MIQQERRSECSTVTSGFTIIEVALVLAIAGLIFLVVFIAWPALQNSQKDTARRQDVNRVVSGLESYKVDHQGDLSGLVTGAWINSSAVGLSGYIGKLSAASGVSITGWMSQSPNAPGTGNASINVYPGSFCSGDTRTATAANAAVIVTLSSGAAYCASV